MYTAYEQAVIGIYNFLILDIPLCLMNNKINKLFIAAIKYNNIFSFPYFNGDIFRSFRPSSGHLTET
jgi:hypothetical protein